jgi:CheY-like chemotaxis protein
MLTYAADDEPEELTRVEEALTKWLPNRFVVQTYDTCNAVLHAIQAQLPDLLIMDLCMRSRPQHDDMEGGPQHDDMEGSPQQDDGRHRMGGVDTRTDPQEASEGKGPAWDVIHFALNQGVKVIVLSKLPENKRVTARLAGRGLVKWLVKDTALRANQGQGLVHAVEDLLPQDDRRRNRR